jgi:ubiquinone/menaquinone biosynthesis C-methylase UbiE
MITDTIKLFLEYDRAIARQFLKLKDLGNFQVKCMYEAKGFVNHYIPESGLQPPEIKIFQELKDELPNIRMLDIGVGAGRTTEHFAPIVKEYIAIDYSRAMVEACRKKFRHYRIEVADARNLGIFRTGYFDFVLFSFNGIDAVEHEDRLKIINEIHRILRKDGYFCFSTLNLISRIIRPPIKLYKNPLLQSIAIYNFALNKNLRKKIKPKHQMVYLKYREFLARLYFILPNEQIKQLLDTGFSETRAFDLENGNEISDLRKCQDFYIYFLTKAK